MIRTRFLSAILLPAAIANAGTGTPRRLPGPEGPTSGGVNGYVMQAGNIRLRLTNRGWFGGDAEVPVPAASCQWPRYSGLEYLMSMRFVVAAKDPEAFDPSLVRRARVGSAWRPRDPSVDRIRSIDPGSASGQRFADDDGDGHIDEEWLDGRDDARLF